FSRAILAGGKTSSKPRQVEGMEMMTVSSVEAAIGLALLPNKRQAGSRG
ncbi:MAG: NADH:ubiquinone oxidoreductase subunit K, partial [Candidatus Krumholzibacteriia bacterium]